MLLFLDSGTHYWAEQMLTNINLWILGVWSLLNKPLFVIEVFGGETFIIFSLPYKALLRYVS